MSASARVQNRVEIIGSPMIVESFILGFREEYGSWNTMFTSRRTARSSDVDRLERGRGSKRSTDGEELDESVRRDHHPTPPRRASRRPADHPPAGSRSARHCCTFQKQRDIGGGRRPPPAGRACPVPPL